MITFALLLFVHKAYAEGLQISKFKTDYCTLFPDGSFSGPKTWQSCCYEHDIEYWIGGTEKDERMADIALKKCIENKGYKFIATVMYYGVRLGHYMPWKLKASASMSYHWGWGRSPNEKEFRAREMTREDYLKLSYTLYPNSLQSLSQ